MWKNGPLPKGTYGWGGVVPYDWEGEGFFFADFKGDSVVCYTGGTDDRVLKPHEVRYYDNSLELPSKKT